MEIPTPIKNIDKVLATLYLFKHPYEYGTLKENSKVFDDEEIKRAILKLMKDGFIERFDKPDMKTQLDGGSYLITFDGVIHHLKNGYEGELITNASYNMRLVSLENHQKDHRNWMTWLTIVLAVGTLLQGVYLMAKLYWEHDWLQYVFPPSKQIELLITVILTLIIATLSVYLYRRKKFK